MPKELLLWCCEYSVEEVQELIRLHAVEFQRVLKVVTEAADPCDVDACRKRQS